MKRQKVSQDTKGADKLGRVNAYPPWPGDVPSAHSWREMIEPIVTYYERGGVRLYVQADVTLANPEICEYLQEHSFLNVDGVKYKICFD